MTELRQSEINLDELKSSIRQAVARREAEGRTAFIKASAELFELLSAEQFGKTLSPGDSAPSADVSLDLSALKLQPEFVPHSDGHYHVNDLLKYHDVAFIWNAYRALLRREPDEEGLRTHLEGLHSGRFNKIDVLTGLRFSPEGRRNDVTIDGLRLRSLIRRLYHLPVFGYFIELTIGVARLPSLIRHQRQVEAYLIAQQEEIVRHFNSGILHSRGISHSLAELRASLSRSFSDLGEEQRRIAYLQHQQLTALFRAQRERSRLSQNGKSDDSRESSLNKERQSPRTHLGQSDRDELQAYLQDQLRGSREKVRANLEIYLPVLEERGISCDVLDIGCGRGEWLELLREKGIEARGIEINHEMVNAARARGLEVFEENILSYLRELPDQNLNAVTGFHFIEHLSFETLVESLDEIKRTLRPGGVVIFETPNPKNLTVAACNFYADPSHHRPVFPDTIEFILKHKGFEQVRLEYLNPIDGSPFRNDHPGSRELDVWFFGPRDFAVIAQKAGRVSKPD